MPEVQKTEYTEAGVYLTASLQSGRIMHAVRDIQNRKDKAMRTIPVSEITRHIKEMCIEANYCLTPDMDCALKRAQQEENPFAGHTDTGTASGQSEDCKKKKRFRFARTQVWP